MISTELKQRCGLLVKNIPTLMCHISIKKDLMTCQETKIL